MELEALLYDLQATMFDFHQQAIDLADSMSGSLAMLQGELRT